MRLGGSVSGTCGRMEPCRRWSTAARHSSPASSAAAAWCSASPRPLLTRAGLQLGLQPWLQTINPAARSRSPPFKNHVYFMKMTARGKLWTKWLSETSPPSVIWWVQGCSFALFCHWSACGRRRYWWRWRARPSCIRAPFPADGAKLVADNAWVVVRVQVPRLACVTRWLWRSVIVVAGSTGWLAVSPVSGDWRASPANLWLHNVVFCADRLEAGAEGPAEPVSSGCCCRHDTQWPQRSFAAAAQHFRASSPHSPNESGGKNPVLSILLLLHTLQTILPTGTHDSLPIFHWRNERKVILHIFEGRCWVPGYTLTSISFIWTYNWICGCCTQFY